MLWGLLSSPSPVIQARKAIESLQVGWQAPAPSAVVPLHEQAWRGSLVFVTLVDSGLVLHLPTVSLAFGRQ